MGQLLDIARRHAALPAPPHPVSSSLPRPTPPRPAAVRPPAPPAPAPLDHPAADVLAALVQADQPLTHTALLHALAERGHDKETARQAIARCQHWRWIEHNLTTGYVLA